MNPEIPMNPEITNIDISSIDTSGMDGSFMGVNMSPSHLIWSTILTLILSHIGANYLKSVTPRGYWFWFTILNLILGFIFM